MSDVPDVLLLNPPCLPACSTTPYLVLCPQVVPFFGDLVCRQFAFEAQAFEDSAGGNRGGSAERETSHRELPENKVGFIPPCYFGRVSFPGEQGLVGRPELNQPLHILLSHWKPRGQRSTSCSNGTMKRHRMQTHYLLL